MIQSVFLVMCYASNNNYKYDDNDDDDDDVERITIIIKF